MLLIALNSWNSLVLCLALEFFTNCPKYKNANIANFVLALPLKINQSNEVFKLEM